MIWYSHHCKSFPQFVMIYIVKGFSIVNETEMFFWNSLAFSIIQQMLAIWSLVPLPFLSRLDIWKFLVHIMLKPGMQDFKHDLTSTGNECNCSMVHFGHPWHMVVPKYYASRELGWGLAFSSPVAAARSFRFADIFNAKPWWHPTLGTEYFWNFISSTSFVNSNAS